MNERIEKLKAFLQQSPNDCFVNHALALEFVKAGDDQTARKHFEHNISIDEQYVASYYHLGKLLERAGDLQAAMTIYEKGMLQAKAVKDMHTYSELQAAYEDIAY
jgi:Tfp pilus assembly protein PilF